MMSAALPVVTWGRFVLRGHGSGEEVWLWAHHKCVEWSPTRQSSTRHTGGWSLGQRQYEQVHTTE